MAETAEQTNAANSDRLSALPDEILIKILTAADLDTRTSIQTCLLSRSWRNLWKSLLATKLSLNFPNLSCFTLSEWYRFKAFVENVLSFGDKEFSGGLDVLSVTADLGYEGVCNLLGQIFHHGLAHRARTLQIVAQTPSNGLPPHLLDLLGSVQNLEITDWLGFGALQKQSREFLELKTLRLYRCEILSTMMSSECYCDDLFGGIPNLTKLELIECRFRTGRPVIISGSKLASIVFVCSNEPHSPSSKTEVTISAPKLKYFKCKGVDPAQFTSFELPSLECLDIDVHLNTDPNLNQVMLDCVSMFSAFRNAEHVKLHPSAITALTIVPGLLEKQESPFKRVKCLQLYDSTRKSVAFTSSVFNSLISYFFDVCVVRITLFHRIFSKQLGTTSKDGYQPPVVIYKSDLNDERV